MGKSLAFAYVSVAALTAPGNLSVLILGEERPARRLTQATYDPGSTILRS